MAGGVNVSLTANVQQFQQQMRQAEQALEHFQKTGKRVGDASGEIAVPMAAAFAGLTLGIAAATRNFGDFEAVLNQVRAVSGATASEMERIKAQAEQLGAATKFSAREAAQAQAELAKSGMNINQVLAATPGVMALAASGQLEVARAAEITGAALNGFGKSAEEAGYVADLLSKAANASALDVSDIGDSLKYIGPIAAATSQSLEDVTQLLAVMGSAGIKGSQGGTALRASLAALAKPSDDAAQQLHDLGISIQDTKGKMLPLADVVGQLRDRTAKLSEVQRANAIATIFGTEAMAGIMAVMNQAPEKAQEVADAFANINGAAEDMSTAMNGGIKGALEQFGGSVDTAAIALVEQFAPAIIAVANGIKGMVDGFTALDPNMKLLIAGAVAAATALTGFAAVASGLAVTVLPGVIAGTVLLGASLGPVIGTIAVLSAGVGIATMAFKAHADSIAAAKRADDEARKARIDHTVKIAAQKAELERLSKEYGVLADKTNRSKEEQKRLKEIQDKLAAEYPGIAKVIAAGATSHDKVEAAVRREITAKQDLLKLDQVAAQQRVMSASTDLANARRKLDELQGQYDAAKSAPSYGDSAGKVQELNVIGGMLAAQQRAVDSINSRVLTSAADLQRVNGIVIPGPTKTKTTDRGGMVDAPAGRAKSGKSEAEKAAEEAHRAQVEALGRLSAAYQRNLQVAQAWGGGTAAEVNMLNKLMADIKAKGLDGIAEGQEAIINAQTRLNVIAGNNVMAKAAKEAADREKFFQKVQDETAQAAKRFWEDEEEAAKKRKQDAEDAAKAAEAFTGSIREMQGALVGLALDPSMERIGDFAQDLAADKDKMKEWGKTLGDIGAAFKDAGSGADGLGAALKLITPSIDPISLGMTAAVFAVQALTKALEGAAKAQQRLKDAAAETSASIRRAQAEMSPDPGAVAYVDYDDGMAAARKEAEAKLQAQKDLRKAADPAFMVKDALMNGALSSRIDAMTFDDFPEIKQELEEKVKVLTQVRDKAVGEAHKPGGKPFEGSLVDLIVGQVTEMHRAAFDEAMAMADIVSELDFGGRDSWGNRISLADERDLRIQEAAADLEEKRTQAVKAQLKLREEIQEIDREERQAIAAIENEGLAVRAVSEFQDKAARIAKVKAEAQAKRDAKNEEINGIGEQMKKEQEAHDKAVSNIRILAGERIAQLTAEKTRLEAITAEMKRQVDLAKQKAAASGGGSSGGGSTTVNIPIPGMGLSVPITIPHAATGGMVKGGIKGKDSVPVMAMPGEVIVSEPVTRGIAAMVNAFQRGTLGMPSRMNMPAGQMVGSGGGFTMGDVHVTVHAAPGMDERRVADAVWGNISTRLRRSGIGR